MSVETRAIAMYGVYFSEVSDAEKFVQQYHPNLKYLDDLPTKAVAEILDAFSGEGVLIGYHVKIGETLEKYETLWNKEFPESQFTPTTHLEVVTF